MFSTIFKYELKYWFRNPSFYIYVFLFLVISTLLSAASAGIFESTTATNGTSFIVNSPMRIGNMFSTLATIIFFLFPSIIGFSVYRDYKSEMHTILYSYPFTKSNYLFAKFFSSVLIVLIIVLFVGIGLSIGYSLPGTNLALLGEFSIIPYLQTYLIYLVPNILLYGAIIFAVVVFTRKIVASFTVLIILIVLQSTLMALFSNPGYDFITGLLDPSGISATEYYIKYWTVAEQNSVAVPIKELIIYNRLLWTGIAILIFGFVYKYFKFNQQPISLSFRKQKGERTIKSNFGSIIRVQLPKVNFDFSFMQYLKTTWKLSNIDFKYITKSIPFIIILLGVTISLLLDYFEGSKFRGTSRLPVTWRMLDYGEAFQLAIIICTFLYAGILNQRAKTSNINILVDSMPIPNWSLLLSKLIALFKMQWILLTVIMITGISFQMYKGYYEFEIGHYLFELYVLNFIYYALWAMMAVYVQTLIKNTYIGLFLLFILFIFVSTAIPNLIGITQNIFLFNKGTVGYSYSDMNGYGSSLSSIFIYSFYWLLFGTLLIIGAGLFYSRGLVGSLKERVAIAKSRFTKKVVLGVGIVSMFFVSTGFCIYYENNVINTTVSAKDMELLIVDVEKKYAKYEDYVQPKIVAVNIELDMYPKELNFDLRGKYVLVNKAAIAIDSILVKYKNYPSTFKFDESSTLVSEDSLFQFNIYRLEKALQPGDSIQLDFTVKNVSNTILNTHSPVLENGTFLSSLKLVPSIGYKRIGLTDPDVRKKHELPEAALKAHPSNVSALGINSLTSDADWIDFEATVSTSKDQIAIAPGYLQKEWIENDRRYFHYKMDQRMLNIYSFNSARYEVKKDTWNDVALEIYYHKGHNKNLDRMMAGMKASLTYNAENFSPYQHKQARIIEFPKTYGSFAQSYPNTIPFSESHGFIADVDDNDIGGIDYAFAVTSHEVAHQWWAHQVIGADVLGATMLTESISEYVRLKTLERVYGKNNMYSFLKYASDHYLRGRKNEAIGEDPLMYISGQPYIRYSKGAVVFYALSDYIGEKNLNKALHKFVEKNKFKEPPYTTSIELVNYIKEVTPDSLQYVIKDMFETITLYNNSIDGYKTTALADGTYKIDIELTVSKYRSDSKGNRSYSDTELEPSNTTDDELKSLPLADYIDIAVFTEEEINGEKKEVELYLKKHKITSIHNTISIIVNKKPTAIGVDPYLKLIDTNSEDNRMNID